MLNKKDFVENKNDVYNALVDYFPANLISDVVINEFGWQSIVADINNSLICNFPRNPEKYEKLLHEKEIVEVLKTNLTLEMPTRLEITDTRYPFFLHRKIKGDHINVNTFTNMSKTEKLTFLDSVSDFFIGFHSIDPSTLVQNSVIPQYKILFEDETEILRNLTPYFSQDKLKDIKDILITYQKEALKDTEYVFCYNDFHGYNFVTDENKKLTGVFDFDKVAVNNRILDLRKVAINYGWNNGVSLLKIYNTKTDDKIDVEKFKLYTIASHLCEFSWMHELDQSILGNIKSVNFSRHVNSLQTELLKYRERQ